jgi:hypothetical protein
MRTFRLTSPSIRGPVMSACKTFSHQQVHQLLDGVLGPGLHAKRIASLADAALASTRLDRQHKDATEPLLLPK